MMAIIFTSCTTTKLSVQHTFLTKEMAERYTIEKLTQIQLYIEGFDLLLVREYTVGTDSVAGGKIIPSIVNSDTVRVNSETKARFLWYDGNTIQVRVEDSTSDIQDYSKAYLEFSPSEKFQIFTLITSNDLISYGGYDDWKIIGKQNKMVITFDPGDMILNQSTRTVSGLDVK